MNGVHDRIANEQGQLRVNRRGELEWTGGPIVDPAGNTLLDLRGPHEEELANDLTLEESAAGDPVRLVASGEDANISISYEAKGSGDHRFNGEVAVYGPSGTYDTADIKIGHDGTDAYVNASGGQVIFQRGGTNEWLIDGTALYPSASLTRGLGRSGNLIGDIFSDGAVKDGNSNPLINFGANALAFFTGTPVAQQTDPGALSNSMGATTTDGTLEAIGDTSAADESPAIERNLTEINEKVEALRSAFVAYTLLG